MNGRKTLAEIRTELAGDAEGCKACATHGECLDHDTQWLDDQAERIFQDQEEICEVHDTPMTDGVCSSCLADREYSDWSGSDGQ
ncbi:hypothetical protein [Streptomyces sp. NPDC051554]|uniref:hypothetical protein n=1 Tax=Streptomyces sp. NPDC051554 TaxID=3365656 RepID=UPI00378F91E5